MTLKQLMGEITPLPYTCEDAGEIYGASEIRASQPRRPGELNSLVARLDGREHKQHAAYLAHAANNFPAMLKALEEVLKLHEKLDRKWTPEDCLKLASATLTLTAAQTVKGM